MTRYADLYRKELARNEQLQVATDQHVAAVNDQLNMLRDFIRDHCLEDQLAVWALKRKPGSE